MVVIATIGTFVALRTNHAKPENQFSVIKDCLNLADGTNRLSQDVGNQLLTYM